jgi:hypothetical protein
MELSSCFGQRGKDTIDVGCKPKFLHIFELREVDEKCEEQKLDN